MSNTLITIARCPKCGDVITVGAYEKRVTCGCGMMLVLSNSATVRGNTIERLVLRAKPDVYAGSW